jgi:hypothetical protein
MSGQPSAQSFVSRQSILDCPLQRLQIYDEMWHVVGKARFIRNFFPSSHQKFRMAGKHKFSRSNVWRVGALPCSPTVLVALLSFFATGCDRGASEEVGVARKFADAVARNNQPLRDSMIATFKFKEYFGNPYVSHDVQTWFQSFYDAKSGAFRGTASADVDRDLTKELDGALIDTAKIEETGMVKVKSPNDGEDGAFFWMVHQEGKPWRVAMVTKGESEVNFR